MGRGKRREPLFSFSPSYRAPRALFFFLPSLPTTQRIEASAEERAPPPPAPSRDLILIQDGHPGEARSARSRRSYGKIGDSEHYTFCETCRRHCLSSLITGTVSLNDLFKSESRYIYKLHQS